MLFFSLIDTPANPQKDGALQKIYNEIKAYQSSDLSSAKSNLVLKHGPHLFVKENKEKLSELAKALFSIMPAPTPVESGAKESLFRLIT